MALEKIKWKLVDKELRDNCQKLQPMLQKGAGDGFNYIYSKWHDYLTYPKPGRKLKKKKIWNNETTQENGNKNIKIHILKIYNYSTFLIAALARRILLDWQLLENCKIPDHRTDIYSSRFHGSAVIYPTHQLINKFVPDNWNHGIGTYVPTAL